ncbi:hypothetical protein BJ912DRAFT_925872 [Pholiota molesta]|nr:hypothetical protein BJ912DRAFT_925872 [Pholiota molesta]
MLLPRQALDDEIEVADSMDYSCVVQTRDIKDSIHGNIKIYPALARFIDTDQFQRLRNIKQLGATSYVWPAASHSRFEHSLARAWADPAWLVPFTRRRLPSEKDGDTSAGTQRELGITDRDIACVEIAGLCHDLGHGPWSHVWDNQLYPPSLGSEMMFNYLVEDNKIPMSTEDQDFVKALIAGEYSRVSHEKEYLFDIIANKRNGLDVDKFDYLCRDGHMTNNAVSFDIHRLLESARVLDNQICYNMKDINLVYNFFNTRFTMHSAVYNHKTTKAIEYMIVDALSAADEYLGITKRMFSPEEYVHLTDHIMTEIEASKVPELARSRAVLKSMHRRKLYRHVEFKSIEWPMRDLFRQNITPARILAAVKDLLADREDKVPMDPTNSVSLEESDIIVDFSTRSYGMKEKNPVDFVRFYSKRNPNKSLNADRGVITSVLPEYFAEDVLNIYTKKRECLSLVQAGYRALLASLDQESDLHGDETTSRDTSAAPTPPNIDMGSPSTPKTLSRKTSLTNPQQLESKTGRSLGTTPFANNALMTLELPTMLFAPSSPSSGKGVKRRRENDATGVSEGVRNKQKR